MTSKKINNAMSIMIYQSRKRKEENHENRKQKEGKQEKGKKEKKRG